MRQRTPSTYLLSLPSIWSILVAALLALPCSSQHQPTTYLFVGTYTEGRPDEGVFVYRFDEETGSLDLVAHGEDLTNPSFLTVSPTGGTVYACTESKMPGFGSVTALAFDSVKGELRLLNKQPSGGENPVHVTMDLSGRWVVNVNYTEASLSVFPVQADGSLGTRAQQFRFMEGSLALQGRQDAAHLHAAVFGPDNKHLYVTDLGGDKIRAFRFDADATQPLLPEDSLTIRTAPGSGPRHLVFHPNGNTAYCVEELGGSIAVYMVDNGRLTLLERLPSYAKRPTVGNSADIHVSADGLFLYASNRGPEENSLSIHRIEQSTGELTLVGHQPTLGDQPRNFTLDPSGRFLLVANLASNEIVVFRRDPGTGLLKKYGNATRVPRPSCLQMRRYEVSR